MKKSSTVPAVEGSAADGRITLLALDCSSTNIGIARFLDDELIALDTLVLVGEIDDRLLQLGQRLVGYLDGVDVLAIESPAHTAKPFAMIAQQRAVGVVLYVWRLHRIGERHPWFEVTPGQGKIALAGSGKASKEEMIQQAGWQFPEALARITEHSADAIGIGLAAKEQLHTAALLRGGAQ